MTNFSLLKGLWAWLTFNSVSMWAPEGAILYPISLQVLPGVSVRTPAAVPTAVPHKSLRRTERGFAAALLHTH